MKRFTWVPIIASVVLLLVVLPVFATDIANTVRPEPPVTAGPAVLEGLADHEVFGDEFEQGGSQCESSGQGGVANPF